MRSQSALQRLLWGEKKRRIHIPIYLHTRIYYVSLSNNVTVCFCIWLRICRFVGLRRQSGVRWTGRLAETRSVRFQIATDVGRAVHSSVELERGSSRIY
jgi:hypothetical protein